MSNVDSIHISNKINEYLDDTLGAEEQAEFEEHLERCEPCRNEVLLSKSLRDACMYVGDEIDNLPVDFHGALMNSLRVEGEKVRALHIVMDAAARKRDNTRRLSMLRPMRIAAVLLITLSVGLGASYLIQMYNDNRYNIDAPTKTAGALTERRVLDDAALLAAEDGDDDAYAGAGESSNAGAPASNNGFFSGGGAGSGSIGDSGTGLNGDAAADGAGVNGAAAANGAGAGGEKGEMTDGGAGGFFAATGTGDISGAGENSEKINAADGSAYVNGDENENPENNNMRSANGESGDGPEIEAAAPEIAGEFNENDAAKIMYAEAPESTGADSAAYAGEPAPQLNVNPEADAVLGASAPNAADTASGAAVQPTAGAPAPTADRPTTATSVTTPATTGATTTAATTLPATTATTTSATATTTKATQSIAVAENTTRTTTAGPTTEGAWAPYTTTTAPAPSPALSVDAQPQPDAVNASPEQPRDVLAPQPAKQNQETAASQNTQADQGAAAGSQDTQKETVYEFIYVFVDLSVNVNDNSSLIRSIARAHSGNSMRTKSDDSQVVWKIELNAYELKSLLGDLNANFTPLYYDITPKDDDSMANVLIQQQIYE